jgi:uncharacterized protein YbjT (DUF2867 family)
MSRTILVAGASGALGREIVRILAARGDRVRAIGRDPGRLAKLQGPGVETMVANASDPIALAPALEGVESVISALGNSTLPSLGLGWRGFGAVDTRLNVNLVDAARGAGAKKFVYVSVHHTPEMRRVAYIDAHERVVDHMRASGLEWAAVRPTGFFSAIGSFVDMAKKGLLPAFGEGGLRTNPIHDIDLAQICVEALDGDEREIPCGGPDALSRRRMAEMAFEALGRPVRTLHMPAWVLRLNGMLLRPFHPRIAQLMSFFAALATRELLAPARGTRGLAAYFKERAASWPGTRSPPR